MYNMLLQKLICDVACACASAPASTTKDDEPLEQQQQQQQQQPQQQQQQQQQLQQPPLDSEQSHQQPLEILPSIKSFSSRHRKQLRDKINKLSQTEHEEIFKMLQHTHANFTQNKNGVFFDISLLDDEFLVKTEQFVDFCINNKIELDEYEKQINECKMNNSFDRIRTTPSSVPLSKAINHIALPNDNWQGLLNETRTNDKINAFVNMLESSSDRLCIKRINTKFINAKKRYSKKSVAERKNEGDLQNNLEHIPYIKLDDCL